MSPHLSPGLIESVQRLIADHGGDLDVGEFLKSPTEPAAVPFRAADYRLTHAVWPKSTDAWEAPTAASLKHSEVRIVRTASHVIALVHVSSHRRRKSSNRRAWFGVDILTGREVRIVRVLMGWRR